MFSWTFPPNKKCPGGQFIWVLKVSDRVDQTLHEQAFSLATPFHGTPVLTRSFYSCPSSLVWWAKLEPWPRGDARRPHKFHDGLRHGGHIAAIDRQAVILAQSRAAVASLTQSAARRWTLRRCASLRPPCTSVSGREPCREAEPSRRPVQPLRVAPDCEPNGY